MSEFGVSEFGVSEFTVIVNGDPMTVGCGSSIADVVAALMAGAEPKGVAVAVDLCVIPRSEWSTTVPRPEAHIEIVTAAAGG